MSEDVSRSEHEENAGSSGGGSAGESHHGCVENFRKQLALLTQDLTFRASDAFLAILFALVAILFHQNYNLQNELNDHQLFWQEKVETLETDLRDLINSYRNHLSKDFEPLTVLVGDLNTAQSRDSKRKGTALQTNEQKLKATIDAVQSLQESYMAMGDLVFGKRNNKEASKKMYSPCYWWPRLPGCQRSGDVYNGNDISFSLWNQIEGMGAEIESLKKDKDSKTTTIQTHGRKINSMQLEINNIKEDVEHPLEKDILESLKKRIAEIEKKTNTKNYDDKPGYISIRSGSCKSFGYVDILDKQSCKAAAMELKLVTDKVKPRIIRTGPYQLVPYGCYKDFDGKLVLGIGVSSEEATATRPIICAHGWTKKTCEDECRKQSCHYIRSCSMDHIRLRDLQSECVCSNNVAYVYKRAQARPPKGAGPSLVF